LGALLTGSLNPIHNGHIDVLNQAKLNI